MTKPTGNKCGRPTLYTDALAKEICRLVSLNPCGLKKLCEDNPSLPKKTTINEWKADRPDFAASYRAAKLVRSEIHEEEILDILFETAGDLIEGPRGLPVGNSSNVQRATLQVNGLFKHMSVLNQEKYGTKRTEITGRNGGTIEISTLEFTPAQLRERLDKLSNAGSAQGAGLDNGTTGNKGTNT